MTLIPVYKRNREILGTYTFKQNLNVRGPRYLNEGCNMGLIRDTQGNLVLMYQHEEFPSSDFAEYVSEDEAYELCLNRGKQCLVEELHLRPSHVME